MIREILLIDTVTGPSKLSTDFTTLKKVDNGCTLVHLVHDVVLVGQVHYFRDVLLTATTPN